MAKNPPACAGDMGSIPGLGRSHMSGSNYGRVPQLLSLWSRAQEPQLLKPVHPRIFALQQRSPCMRNPSTAVKSSPYPPQLEKAHAQHSNQPIFKKKMGNDTQYSVVTHRGKESKSVDTATRE